MIYGEIRGYMEYKLTHQKGILTESEITLMISQWEDDRPEKEFNVNIAKQEIERMQEMFKRYNVPEVGHMKEEKEAD